MDPNIVILVLLGVLIVLAEGSAVDTVHLHVVLVRLALILRKEQGSRDFSVSRFFASNNLSSSSGKSLSQAVAAPNTS